MWVVKIGGSLTEAAPVEPPQAHDARRLLDWLDLIVSLGGGRVAVVPGGGAFADGVRRAQAQWRIDDLSAHNMAVLAMAQTAHLLRALRPALPLAHSATEIRALLRRGQPALWLPLEAMREQPDPTTQWGTTSDSLALGLARRLNAERLVLVKRCRVPAGSGAPDWAASGVVDADFPALAAEAPFPIDLVHEDDHPRLRALLLGELRLPV